MTIREALETVGVDNVRRGMRVFDMKKEDHIHASQCFVGFMIDGKPGDFSHMLDIGSKAHREACWKLSDEYESEYTRKDLRVEAEVFLAESTK